MINVEIIEAAEAELFKAAEFYGRQSAGLRAAFIDEFERVVGLIVDHPAIGAPYEGGTRRVLLDRATTLDALGMCPQTSGGVVRASEIQNWSRNIATLWPACRS